MDNKFKNKDIGALVLVLGLTLLGLLFLVTGEFLWLMLWPGVFLVSFVYIVDENEFF